MKKRDMDTSKVEEKILDSLSDKENTMKPDNLPPTKRGPKEIEVMSGAIKEMGDNEKLIRYRCAQSLFNISNDLKEAELIASNVCLIIAKGLIADLKLPEATGSMHTSQTLHNSNVPAEVEAMAMKIKEEING